MKLTFSPPALKDFWGISDYAASISQTYHDQLTQEIEKACRKLTKFPDAWPHYSIGDRKFRVRYVGKYAIYYQVLSNKVIIQMIIHSARDVASALEGRELWDPESGAKD